MPPDFPGNWRLNLADSRLSPEVAAAATGGGLHIEHREPVLRCRLTAQFGDQPIDMKFELSTDNPDGSLRWDGEALVATFEQETPDGAMTIVFRYELADDGRRLRASEQLRSAARNQDNIWVYDRG